MKGSLNRVGYIVFIQNDPLKNCAACWIIKPSDFFKWKYNKLWLIYNKNYVIIIFKKDKIIEKLATFGVFLIKSKSLLTSKYDTY